MVLMDIYYFKLKFKSYVTSGLKKLRNRRIDSNFPNSKTLLLGLVSDVYSIFLSYSFMSLLLKKNERKYKQNKIGISSYHV